jgi:glutathione S-transferase
MSGSGCGCVNGRRRCRPTSLASDELWSEGLARFGGPFLAGPDFTIVDAFYCPVAFRVRTYDVRLSGAARDYATRLLHLPAMLEWERAALDEPWREISHEREVAAAGDIIEDLRRPPAGTA